MMNDGTISQHSKIIFSCDEQLKKWRCHSFRVFVCSFVPKEFFVVIRRFQGVLCRHKTIWRVIGINREVTPAQKEFGCFEGPRMCQGCYTVLLGSCQGCFNGYLRRYIMSVSMVIYGCVSVSRVLHEWIKGISWVCKGCFMSESGIFLECYKDVYWTRNI